MIGSQAARHNREAALILGGRDPLHTGEVTLPCIEVARAKVYGYVEAVDDGLRLVTSVHLGRLRKALVQDGLVPLLITVNGFEVFDALFPPSRAHAKEVPPEQEAAANYNREAVLLPGSGWDPLGDGGAPLPCIAVAGTQVYGYVEDFGGGLRLVVSLHLDGEGEIPPELLRGDLVPVRIAVNGTEVFSA